MITAKRIAVLAVVLCLGMSMYASAENNSLKPIVEQAKEWNYNIGDMAYVPGEGFYYGVGIDIDANKVLDGVPENWLFLSAGYLAIKLSDNSKGDNQFGYAGISFNAGRCISFGIEYIAQATGSSFVMPKFCKESLLKVGIFGAKKLENIGEITNGWAGAIRVSLVTIKF